MDKYWLRKLIFSFLWLIIFITFFTVLVEKLILNNPRFFPLRQVKIDVIGSCTATAELKKIIVPYIFNKGFFSLSTGLLKLIVMKLPWISKVTVQRIWPDKLEIIAVEQQQAARWKNSKLISKLGTLFTAPSSIISKNLPQLQGPDSSEKAIFSRFEKFTRLLKPLRIKITVFQVCNRDLLLLTLNNDTKIYLEYKDIDQRFRKLIFFYRQLINHKNEYQIDRIDLRYSNGLAVHWKSNFIHIPCK
ncbi:cell division protein FtsQ/DivIB [Coxiella endosymbiont of Amblyomma americanum]|uniref:cell division protein FtsQ/DivIB n=1 Tax=Coxiella endosymbiont of Amblyomma americanum TaxID=325775 RepID=UPI00057DFFD2|nr:cell division protein FtsQ/DivIB [Coxiella endosymbiont of Amblyomma americanum]AJC50397.1 Cell division septal protein [Coxiella endosymbiont of Amblyomma americanum]AUJ58738.1 hypothetical protein B1F76_01410 [Coxiella-like endosymbiont of Amblyomma americanum]